MRTHIIVRRYLIICINIVVIRVHSNYYHFYYYYFMEKKKEEKKTGYDPHTRAIYLQQCAIDVPGCVYKTCSECRHRVASGLHARPTTCMFCPVPIQLGDGLGTRIHLYIIDQSAQYVHMDTFFYFFYV